MNRSRLSRSAPQIIAFSVLAVMFISVIYLMRNVQTLLNTDVQINLTEVVTQNKDVITSKLNVAVSKLEMLADQLSDRMLLQGFTGSDEDLLAVYHDYLSNNESDSPFVADCDGNAYFADGSSLSISGRTYFKLAVNGIQNISDRLVSRQDGEEVFVISAPVTYNGKIVGTVQESYTPDEMYELCSVSLFSDQGFISIINGEGYILLTSQNREYSQEADNYFRLLYAEGNEQASKTLEKNIKGNDSGFMEMKLEGVNYFSAYTPVESIHDWYLISSVATSAVSPNANIVIQLFYIILSVVIIVFGGCLFFFFSYQKKQQDVLRQIAFVDPITQGDSFSRFQEDVRAALEDDNSEWWLLALDIDNFKYVNNYYGFDQGDQLLYRTYHAVAALLQSDERVARISGDHFIALLKNATTDRLNELLAAIQTKDEMAVYFSAGVYRITDRNESVNLMVDKASTASHEAKGIFFKKVEFYSEESDQLIIHNEQMKRAVELALEGGEIIPYFQPKVNVDTGQLVGAEALARWRKPDGSLVSPGEFIPVCEKTGLVVSLDLAVFEQTLSYLKRNLEAGYSCVPISVNFSRRHLSNSSFLDDIASMLAKYGVPAELIEVELTESVFFDNYEIIREFVDRLHGMGLLIDMDDFGSGYSSLNMLMDIPIDVLKIDRAFLKSTENSEKQRIILSAITQMAQQLQMSVVVEGVETKENVSLMKDFGCMVAQGYYFARPMPPEEFEILFRKGYIC